MKPSSSNAGDAENSLKKSPSLHSEDPELPIATEDAVDGKEGENGTVAGKLPDSAPSLEGKWLAFWDLWGGLQIGSPSSNLLNWGVLKGGR